MVHFDASSKIQQIRLYWDQGSLLKLVDVIGSRGRNWPIKDGKEQIRLITSTASATSMEAPIKQMGDMSIPHTPRPKKNPTNDPHTSLSLFDPRDETEAPELASPSIAPRASAKPPPRDYQELFVGNGSDQSPAASERTVSPSKSNHIAPKAGAGKNYHPSRLFDVEEPELSVNGSPTKSPEKYLSPHPSKYNHFEFDDSHHEPTPQPAKPRQKTKHQSLWDFEDFATSAKITQKERPHSRPRVFDFAEENQPVPTSPSKKLNAAQSRRDAETHFEFQDDGMPPSHRRAGHPRGQGNASMSASLFQNNVFDEGSDGSANAANETSRPHSSGTANANTTATSLEDRRKDFNPHFQMTDAPTDDSESAGAEIKPLSTATNLKDRHKDFDPKFEMADYLPSSDSGALTERGAGANNRPLNENRSKAVRMMEASWEAADPSPVAENRFGDGINVKGDGMGGRKACEGAGPAGKGKENAGIKTGGDGMGGRKGMARAWGFGDESGGEEEKRPVGRKAQAQAQKTDNFWDF